MEAKPTFKMQPSERDEAYYRWIRLDMITECCTYADGYTSTTTGEAEAAGPTVGIEPYRAASDPYSVNSDR